MATLDCKVIEQTENGLYYRQWPIEALKAVILLVHGMGEHCQRYNPIAQELNQSGYAVCSMDLPNHGRSAGKKGHVDSFDLFQNAVLGLYQRIKNDYPTSPIFILGHSMGGLITTRFLMDHQDKFVGAILSGPAIELPDETPKWQVGLIKGISKLFPTTGLIPIDGSLVSRDKSVIEAYYNDPLINQNKLSAKLLIEFDKTMREVKQGAEVIKLPILLMHGRADQITAPSGSEWLHDAVQSQDKTLKLYEDLYHEIFNEPEAQGVYSDVIEWLNKRNDNLSV